MFLRLILLLSCIPCAGILLLKIYGIMEMDRGALFLLLPCSIIFISVWIYLAIKKYDLSKVLLAGLLGGLVGTICYDLIRVPFWFMGQSIFIPIKMYGVWLTDANASDSFTDLIGWIYHFSNGITFGIMYSLVMKNKSIYWAILYALLLETIFVFSPYGSLFGFTEKPWALFVAYLGHIAYGYPLGLLLKNFALTLTSIDFFSKIIASFFILSGIITIGFLFITSRSREVSTGIITVLRKEIKPQIIRIKKGETVTFHNGTTVQQLLFLSLFKKNMLLEGSKQEELLFTKPGIFHLFIENKAQVNPAFVICEPIHEFK